LSKKSQFLAFIISSILIGVLYNTFRDDGITLIAQPIETITSVDEAISILTEPKIREINLKMAIQLFESGVLFVDARAEEYLNNGFIPGAIANDNIDLLTELIDTRIGYETGFVIYCSDDDCGSSEELAYDLQYSGFSNIFVFKGGWKSWSEAGLEIQTNE
jgi:3-mercaptopyruvate sulfurtransferase SseA